MVGALGSERSHNPEAALSEAERARFERDGYLVLRDHLTRQTLERLDRGVERHVPCHAYAPGKVYPEPAKYTLSRQIPADPDLAHIIEHPRIVDPVEALLGGEACLTAYVVYVRTPGDPGSVAHNDYKRWRPVGSSMRWLFAIVPLDDFDEAHGPLLVVPGSHQPERTFAETGLDAGPAFRGRFLGRRRPDEPSPGDFVDPGLRRGDVLLMSMSLWHHAPPNRLRRRGIFNKYAAVDAPPATGYFVYREAVREALSPAGRRMLPVVSDLPVGRTRALLTRSGAAGGPALLLVPAGDGRWTLPGCAGWEEDAIPGWDHGSRIGALLAHLHQDLGLPEDTLDWLSYVGDYEERAGSERMLCRVYGHPVPAPDRAPDRAPGRAPIEPAAGRWVTRSELAGWPPGRLAHGFERRALDDWLEREVTRGKGLAQARAKVDQYDV